MFWNLHIHLFSAFKTFSLIEAIFYQFWWIFSYSYISGDSKILTFRSSINYTLI